MAQPAIVDPYRNYNFLLKIQDIAEARFTECFGLDVDIPVITYKESGSGSTVRAIPASVRYGILTLRYGLTKTSSRGMWDWLTQSIKGTVQRRHVTVVTLDPDGVTEVIQHNLIDAWPCGWSGVPYNALGRDMAIEELRLAFDSLDRTQT
ncbi:MAG TPA: phage tail protein [Rhizomicrobium sp.]|nr:phage tail protein [Rhizomicrobium sp.]